MVPLKLLHEFDTNVFRSSVDRKVKAENRVSIFGTKYSKVDSFAVVGVVNTEIFIKVPFYKQTGQSQQFNVLFFEDIFLGAPAGQPV